MKGKVMKIVLSAQGPSMDDNVDPRFGRAKFFICVDSETGDFTAHDNTQNLNAAQGAGIQAASNVAELGADVVITGNVGPKAFSALQAGSIKIYTGATGSVKEALELYNAGKLACAGEANVEGHWM